MRELTASEVDKVSGGFGWLGAGIGGVTGFTTGMMSGLGARDIATQTLLGAMSGFAGGMAGSALAGGYIVRGAWAVRAVGIGSVSTGAGSNTGNTAGREDEDS